MGNLNKNKNTTKMGDQFTQKIEQFEFPYDLKTEDITVVDQQVSENALIDRFKTVLKEALAKSKDLKEASKYVKAQLEAQEDGIWFAGAWFDGMKSAQYW